MKLTPEQIAIIDKLENFDYFVAQGFLKIKDKSANLITFKLNKAQEIVLSKIKETKQLRKLLRFIILKARQKGISTFFEALIFHSGITNFNIKAVIIGHESDASSNLFAMSNRYLENLPDYLKPQIEHSNEKKLSFSKLKSEIRIATAEGGASVKRSDTIQYLHATEVAFYRDAKNTLLAVMQTVPDEPNTLIVLESTANGVGGEFYDRWQSAVAGESDYIPIFLSWLIDDEYSKPFSSEDEKQKLLSTIDQEEIVLRDKLGASLEQLNWRRHTIQNKCGGDVSLFHQEYPSTPEEAFIVSGRPVFDNILVYDRYNDCREPLAIGNLVYLYEEDKITKIQKIAGVKFVENSKGFIKIFSPCLTDAREYYVYAAGCDVSEGLEQGDYSVIKVMDRRTNKVCLTWHGHISADLLAEEQHKIQLYLKNKVYFATEQNNHGLTTITHAYRLGVNQYYRQKFESVMETDKLKDILGFKTTTSTKPYIINDLNSAIREKYFIDDEKEFWGECLTFVHNAKGQMQAQDKDKDPATKCFDDRVMASAIMLICDKWMLNYFVEPEKEKDSEAIARSFAIQSNEKAGDYTF
jgi:hypothetical protein